MTTEKPKLLAPDLEVITRVFRDRSALVWRLERVDERWAKIPYGLDGRRCDGTKPTAWSVDQACDAYQTGRFDGVGVPISDGLVMHDEDHKLDALNGIQSDALERIRLLDSYTEVSPSGEGLHVFATGRMPNPLPPGRRRGAWEMYSSGRYSTVTGVTIDGFPETINFRPSQLEQLALQLTEASTAGHENIGAPVAWTLPAVIGQAHRHDTLWRHMRSMKAKGKDFEECLFECQRVNNERCQPPLSADEVRAYLERVFYVADRPGFGMPTIQFQGDDL